MDTYSKKPDAGKTTDCPALPPNSPKVRIVAGPGSANQKTWNLRQPVTLIGSKRTSMIHLAGEEVSRSHCLIVNTGATVLVRDLASRTGLICDGQSITLGQLQDGNVLDIGVYQIRMAIEDGSHDAGDTLGHEPTRMPIDIALVDEQGQHHTIQQAVSLIGSREACELVIDGENVGVAHAAISHVMGQPVICDLATEYGTFVNGERVTTAYLANGDHLQLGSQEFLVEVKMPSETVAEVNAQEKEAPVQSGPVAEAAAEAIAAVDTAPEPVVEPADRSPDAPVDVAAEPTVAAEPEPIVEPQPTVEPAVSAEAAVVVEPETPVAPEPIAEAPMETLQPSPEWQGQTPKISQRIEQVQSNILTIQKDVLSWWDQLTTWQTQLEAHAKQIADRITQLDRRDADLAAKLDAYRQQHDQLDSQRTQLEQARAEIDRDRQQLTEAQSQLDAQRADLAQAKDAFESAQRQAEGDLASREQKLAEQRTQLDAQQKALDEQMAEIARRQAGMADLEQRESALGQREASLGEREAALGQCETDLQARESKVQAAQEQLATLQAEMQQREAMVESQQSVLNEFQASLEQANHSFQESLTARMASLNDLMHTTADAIGLGSDAVGDTSAEPQPSGEPDPAAADLNEAQPLDVTLEPAEPAEPSAQADVDVEPKMPEPAPTDKTVSSDKNAPAKEDAPAEQAVSAEVIEDTPTPAEPASTTPAKGSPEWTFSLDLDPEIADKLRTLRRLTNGTKSDEEILEQIRREQAAQIEEGDRAKKARWWR